MQYLDIPGIPGESLHDTNQNWNNKIQINHFTYDISQRASLGTGSGLVASGASMSHLSFTKTMDKSTPMLWFKLCSGEPIPKVIFRKTQAGGVEGVYEIHTLECESPSAWARSKRPSITASRAPRKAPLLTASTSCRV
jgi:type VI secretion system Hcp family effector